MFDHVLSLHDFDVIRTALAGFDLGSQFPLDFRDLLRRRFELCDPELADKLQRLDEAQLDALYQRLREEQLAATA